MRQLASTPQREAMLVAATSATLLTLCRIFQAPLAVVVVAGVICIALALQSPVGGLGAVVVTLPWFFEPLEVRNSSFPLSELLLVAAFAGAGATLIRRLVTRSAGRVEATTVLEQVRRSRALPLAAALAALGLLHLIWLNERTIFSSALREWRWTMAEPLLLVLLLTLVCRERWTAPFLAGCLVAATTLAALQGLTDLFQGTGVMAEGVRRVTGPYRHPNALALFLARGWALTAAWWWFEPRARRLLAVPVVTITLGLAATFSRGALAATAIVIIVLACVAAPKVRLLALAGACLAVIGLVVVAGARMFDTFGGGSASLRIDIWRSAIDMLRDHPWWGYGPDGFITSYAPRYIQPTAWGERFTSHAHNLLLDFWLRLGIIGAAFAALAVVWCCTAVLHVVRGSERVAKVSVIAVLGLLAALVHGMVDNAYFAHDLAMSAWLLVWLAIDQRGSDSKEGTVDLACPRRWRFWLHRLTPVR